MEKREIQKEETEGMSPALAPEHPLLFEAINLTGTSYETTLFFTWTVVSYPLVH